MGRSDENRGFVCAHCGSQVQPLSNGSYRNHCPVCLWSRHVDRKPGDRANACGGLMEPLAVRQTTKGLQLVHRCCACSTVRVNRVAERTRQPDDIERIVELMSTSMEQGGRWSGSDW